jgi:hypothetical protein
MILNTVSRFGFSVELQLDGSHVRCILSGYFRILQDTSSGYVSKLDNKCTLTHVKGQITGPRTVTIMEPDRGDAGEPNEGSLRRLGGRGFPGGSLIGTLLSGLYAARARALFCCLFIADGASCSDGELPVSFVCQKTKNFHRRQEQDQNAFARGGRPVAGSNRAMQIARDAGSRRHELGTGLLLYPFLDLGAELRASARPLPLPRPDGGLRQRTDLLGLVRIR